MRDFGCLTVHSNSFFQEINRIALPDYIPTDVDISQLPVNGIVHGFTFTTDAINIHFLETGSCGCATHKWMPLVDDVMIVLFVADLSSYDQLNPESSATRLTETLVHFDSVVNSQRLMRTSIILFLNNVSRFKQKLDKHPLQNYFPDYDGGNDVTTAAKYIIRRFNQTNRARLNLFTYLTEATDPSITRVVVTAIKEAMRQDNFCVPDKREK